MDPIGAQLIQQAMVFAGVMIALGSLVFLRYNHTKRQSRTLTPSAEKEILRRLDELTTHLDRIESSIDASAIEIERISEAQRFTTRLLAERVSPSPEPPAAPPASKANRA
jgi:hypothetical protein